MNKLWIGGALLATLAAVYFAPEPEEEDSVSQPVTRPATPARAGIDAVDNRSGAGMAATGAGGFDLRVHAREGMEDMGNLFGAAAAAPAVQVAAKPPPAPKRKAGPPPPPAAPQAPPLPFQYRGRWIDEGRAAYFLQFNERNLVLHEGEVVDQTWKLEQVSAGQLTFVYLPLNQKQSLAVGDVN